MATIANQIKRISDSRDLLRSRGKSLGLQVPSGNYWDDATNTYKAYTAAALTDSDQIDKIAAAFNTITLYRDQNGKNEIRVPISVRTDGENTVVETTTLAPGYYYNTTVIPYVKVEQVQDIVINVEMVTNRELSAQSGVIKPSAGFNYMGQFGYTITAGAISGSPVSYDNTGVTAKVETSGWLDAGATKKIVVPTSKIKVGSADATDTTSTTVTPAAGADTTVTVGKGIYGVDRTITIKSVSSQTQGNASVNDILSGKIAWVNGNQIVGKMPNFGGTSSAEAYEKASSFNSYSGFLAIQPKLGYYNDYSTIYTDIVYNPTRVFNTTSVTVGGTDTMAAQTYFETIPAGYYHTAIIRKITVQNAVGSMAIDYSGHKAKLTISKAGWIDQGDIVDVAISAGEARFVLQESDLTTNSVALEPSRDEDDNITSYLTKVTVDNTVIFDLLSAI